jgi:hypothetical protein
MCSQPTLRRSSWSAGREELQAGDRRGDQTGPGPALGAAAAADQAAGDGEQAQPAVWVPSGGRARSAPASASRPAARRPGTRSRTTAGSAQSPLLSDLGVSPLMTDATRALHERVAREPRQS